MVLPGLLLQKPSATRKTKDHIDNLMKRLVLTSNLRSKSYTEAINIWQT